MTFSTETYPAVAKAGDEASLGRLLDCLRHADEFDFTGYQRSSLSRRVGVRMDRVGIGDFDSYCDYLRRTPGEAAALCNTIWINVTAFFRDTAVWEHLRACALPELLSRRPPGSPVRIWSAGCASGQEAYSIAMLLAEDLGPAEYAERVTIQATDVDQEALFDARRGIYNHAAMAVIPADFRDKYFTQLSEGWQVRGELRRSVTFRRQNLLRRRPEGMFDLIVCRNTLIYFAAEGQRQVLGRMRRSLTVDGYLLLGRGECPIFHDVGRPYAEHFGVANLATRLYRRALI